MKQEIESVQGNPEFHPSFIPEDTLEENPEHTEKAIDEKEFFESKEQQIADLFSYLQIEVPQETQKLLGKLFSETEIIALKDVLDIPLPKDINPVALFKSISRLTGVPVQTVGAKEKLSYFFSKDLLPRKNAFAVYRTAELLRKQGKEDLRIAYPGSGQDSTGYLSDIGKTSFSTIDTFGLDSGVDAVGNRKVKASGKENNYHYGDFHTVVEKNPALHGKFDAAIIEMLSGAGAIRDFSKDITRLLQDDGMIVVTKMGGKSQVDQRLQFFYEKQGKFTDEFECVGDTHTHVFYKRKQKESEEIVMEEEAFDVAA